MFWKIIILVKFYDPIDTFILLINLKAENPDVRTSFKWLESTPWFFLLEHLLLATKETSVTVKIIQVEKHIKIRCVVLLVFLSFKLFLCLFIPHLIAWYYVINCIIWGDLRGGSVVKSNFWSFIGPRFSI